MQNHTHSVQPTQFECCSRPTFYRRRPSLQGSGEGSKASKTKTQLPSTRTVRPKLILSCNWVSGGLEVNEKGGFTKLKYACVKSNLFLGELDYTT